MVKHAVIGLQYGDEGKAKVVDFFLAAYLMAVARDHPRYQIVARSQGGQNAGHTQWFGNKKVVLHIIPSGITHPDIYNVVLVRCFFDCSDEGGALDEVRELEKQDYVLTPDNFGISGRAHVTLPYHKKTEKLMEAARSRQVGSTLRGIAPTAVTKTGRTGIRFAEFCGDDFEDILYETLRTENKLLGTRYSAKRTMKVCRKSREYFKQFLIDEAELLRDRGHENWLFEQAQATGLDMDFGSYPFNTSSYTRSPQYKTDANFGVVKAFLTRVGEGPRISTMDPEIEARVRGEKGVDPTADFGATTGRPRTCLWFDAPLALLGATVAEIDKLAIVKLDKLDGIDPVRICTHYEHDGQRLELPPQDRRIYDQCTPVWKELSGWPAGSSQGAKSKADLHPNAVNYVEEIGDLLKRPPELVSVGPEAEQTIWW